MTEETLLSAARRAVRFYRIDNETGGGLMTVQTHEAIETLDKMVRQAMATEAENEHHG